MDESNSTTAAAAVQMGGGADTLTNYGRIEGLNGLAIDMGAGDDTLKLFNGGSTGVVVGSIGGGTGSDTLETGGTQRYASGTLSGFETFIVRDGSTVFDYSLGAVAALQVDAGASVQINGDVSTTGNVTLNGTYLASSVKSMRTVAVGGNLTLGAAAVVEMGLGAGNGADKFQVTGTTTFTAGARIRPVVRGYVAAGNYTLVQGGVTGTPGLVADANSATVSYALSASGGNLLLTASRPASMRSLASAHNGALADALEALGQGGSSAANDLLAALDSQTSAAAFNEALQQIAPDTRAAVMQASQLANDTLFSAFGNRIDIARSGGFTQGERGFSAGETRNRRAWVEGLGAWGEQDPRADASGYKLASGGLGLGFEVDRAVGEVMGVSLGYTQSRVYGIASADGDDVNVDGYHVGGYLSRTREGGSLDASVILGYNDYDSQRQVAFTGFSETVRGDYDGWSLSGRAEYGIPFAMSSLWSGRWLLGANAAYLATGGYTEQGSAAAAQRVNDSEATSLQSVLGVELTHAISSTSQMQLRARYLHEFADAPDVEASFVAGGATFTAEGDKPNRDTLQLGISYRKVTAQGVTIGVGYDAQIKDQYLAHQFSARAVWDF